MQYDFAKQYVNICFCESFRLPFVTGIWKYPFDVKPMNSVGERIKARRLELGWTQEELCKKAGISTGFLSDLENKKRSVSAETLLDIARVLSLSLDYLMKGDAAQVQSEEVQIPASLSDFAKSENISFIQALMLLDMQRQIIAHRSTSKADDLQNVNWKSFYDSVKGFL